MTASPHDHRELLDRLLKGQPVETLDSRTLGGKATYRADRGQPLEAALLFEAASRRAAEDADELTALEHAARAALCCFEAGEVGRAVPMWREVIAWHGRVGPNRDDHMVEWGFYHLLLFAAQEMDRRAFVTLFTEAERTAPSFPRIHPHQAELLELAVTLGCNDLVAKIAAAIYRRRPISRALRARLKQLGLGPSR